MPSRSLRATEMVTHGHFSRPRSTEQAHVARQTGADRGKATGYGEIGPEKNGDTRPGYVKHSY
jgi:hypothetical protein